MADGIHNEPTLVIMGTKDLDWPDPEAEARFIVEAQSGKLVLIEGASHYPLTEMPTQTIPTILDFLYCVDGAEARQ